MSASAAAAAQEPAMVAAAAVSNSYTPEVQQAIDKMRWLRRETHGMFLRYDGSTVDTPENRALWAEHAHKIAAQLPHDVLRNGNGELVAAYLECVTYHTASMGVVKAVVTGNAMSFLSAANTLMKRHPEEADGQGFIVYAAYLVGAPWPVCSPKGAVTYCERALAINPSGKRNLYLSAVAYLAAGDKSRARDMFARARAAPRVLVIEQDVGDFIDRECEAALEALPPPQS